jgi:glycosyltransferase involved in cell wall biosynthesis
VKNLSVTIISQYYPPEVGAPQNRLSELAVRLKRSGVDVHVITAMPNYPHMKIAEGYRGKWRVNEEIEGIKVTRCWIFVPKSKSIVPRLLNYFSFVFSSFWIGLVRMRRCDYLICESPPLFLGITAFMLSRLKGTRMIFNVSDLWPESAEKLGLVKNRFLLNVSTWLEEFLYRRSFLITGQTQGIVKNISDRFPRKEVYWLPNGVDISLYDPAKVAAAARSRFGFTEDDRLFCYAGIIGHAQGLEVILNAANELKSEPNVKFILLGEGPEKIRLKEMAAALNIVNVSFIDAIAKTEMPSFVKMIDASVIPLRKLELFKGAIPSKIFESLAMEKPILLGVEGEAYDLFIANGKSGLAFEPENVASLVQQVKQMMKQPDLFQVMGANGRKYVSENFERNKIAESFFRLLKDRNVKGNQA